jgi:beta propeller repeat protein
MTKCLKWSISLFVVFFIVFLSGYHFIKPFIILNPLEIKKVQATSIYRKSVSGGPVRYLSQDGDYIVGIEEESDQTDYDSVFLYDTNGTLSNENDDSSAIIFTSNGGYISHTIIYGDFVTFSILNDDDVSYSLKGYKISTNTLFTIDSNMNDDTYSRDDINVVFSFNGNSSIDIKGYNLSTQSTINIVLASGDQIFPNIKNNIVVWTDESNSDSDIYGYNLTTSQQFSVASTGNCEYNAITNSNWITYICKTINAVEVRKYNVATQVDSLINSYALDYYIQLNDINPSFLSYSVRSTGWNQSIYLYNFNNSTTTTVESTTSIIHNVLLGDTQLVYFIEHSSTDSSIMGNIYGYDTSNSAKYNIRVVGETFFQININKDNDYLIMTSKGTLNDPDEWDVSLAIIP